MIEMGCDDRDNGLKGASKSGNIKVMIKMLEKGANQHDLILSKPIICLVINLIGKKDMEHFHTVSRKFQPLPNTSKIKKHTTKRNPSGRNTWNYFANLKWNMTKHFWMSRSIS
mgnify:CR=1 FL=1